MERDGYRFYCSGSRGSRPMEGIRFNEFGGYTSCYILTKDDYALIIDCGTGLYAAPGIVSGCTKIDIVLTHMHYDHILGLLDWGALPKNADIRFHAGISEWFGEESFKEFFRAPFWPVQPAFYPEQIPPEGEPLVLRDDLTVEFYPAPHPNHSKLMIIRSGERKIVIMFDCEYSNGLPIREIAGADLLLYDGTYTDEEYESRVGWGHSTWQEGVRLALKALPKRLIITHHEPNRTDEDLRTFEKKAQMVYPATDFARAGQVWILPVEEVIPGYEEDIPKRGLKERVKELEKRFDELLADSSRFQSFVRISCYTVLGLVSAFMTIVNIITGEKLLMWSTLVFSCMCFLSVLLATVFKKKPLVALTVFEASFFILLVFFIVTGVPEGFATLWILLLPSSGMLVLERKRASVINGLMFLVLLFFLYTPIGRGLLRYPYSDAFMLRFPMAFMAFFALALVLEIIRAKTASELENLRSNQEKIIANQTMELRDQNWELSSVNSSLEMRKNLLEQIVGHALSDEEVRDMLRKSKEEAKK